MTSPAVWMERLRSKSSHYKSLAEQSKLARAALLERRYGLDIEEKAALRACLDHLSEAIPVRDALSMAERLEAIARKITSESGGNVSLNFMAAPVHGCFYLSTEMFYVEINIDSAGRVNEAKVHHIDPTQQHQQHNSRNCPEIIECLSVGNFSQFVEHLNGLISVYNLPEASSADKTRAWTALTVLEQDLELLYNSYSGWQMDPIQFMHQTPLGLVHPRAGGISMKLRYFMAPHELLDVTTGKLMQCTLDNISKHDLGLSVTIGLEKSPTPRFLPLRSLIGTNKLGQPVDLPLSNTNSVALPARFVMKLSHPMPLSLAKCREIAQLTEIDFFNEVGATPLIQLIVKTSSNDELDSSNNRGLFVTLPDQQHCYFLTDHPDLMGVLVSSIPFSLARNVSDILSILRQQALFNTLISSCVRTNSHQDLDKAVMFEVMSMDLHHLTVTFEIVTEESMATVEFDLTDINNIRCNVYSPNTATPFCPEELASKIIQRSLSIPITMRSLIRHGQCRIKSDPDPESETASSASAINGNLRDPNQNFNSMDFTLSAVSSRSNSLGLSDVSIKTEPMEFESESGPTIEDPLNTFGPQDVTFNPGASAKSTDLRNDRGTSHPIRSGEPTAQPKRNHFDNSKLIGCPEIKIEASSPNPSPKMGNNSSNNSESRKEGSSKTSVAIKLPSGGRSGYKSSATKSNHKSSVSILPVSSADSQVAPSTTIKKACGIEIIPLDVAPSDSMDSKLNVSKSWNKEVRRSLSEDDKRKFDRREGSSVGSSSGSASKKRKHDFDRGSISGHKKSSSPGSPNSKRHLVVGSDKSKSKTSSSGSISTSKIKFSSVIETAAPTSGIEILPATTTTTTTSTSAGSSPPSKTTSSSGKDRSKSESPGLKLTIKNSSGSSSSSGKHRSEHYHKSSSGKSSSSKTTSSSSSNKPRTSSSTNQQQKYPTYKSSSSSPSSSKHGGSNSSSSHKVRYDKDRERERERAEEVKRLLGGGKLNTTFQIPKLASKQDDIAIATSIVSSTTSASANKSGYGHGSGQSGPRAPTTSPKYPPSTASPKYPTTSSASVSPKMSVSPKHFLHGSTGALVSPKPPNPGGGNITPPNISPKHSTSSSKKTPSSSPTHGSQHSSSGSNNPIKLPPPMPVNSSRSGPTSSGQSSSSQRPNSDSLSKTGRTTDE